MNKRYVIQWWHLNIEGIFTGPSYRWEWKAKVKCWLANKTLTSDGQRRFFVTESYL